MLLTKILFAAIIVICACFYILYVWDFALVLLIVMLILPIIMFTTTFITSRCIEADFALKDKTVTKNTDFPIQLCVENTSIFSVGKAEARIEYYNVFNNSISTFDIFMPVQPSNSQRMTFQISSEFCGTIVVRLARITIYDPLRLFKFRICKNIQTEVTVLPLFHEINGEVTESDRIDDESEVFSENKPGDDPSEVFSLREYIAGDKLNRIHWKLTSKKNKFIVKEYSLPVDIPSTIFLDLKCYEDSENTLPMFDTLLETVLSVSQFLAENERMHSIVYYNGKKKRFVDRCIKDGSELSDFVGELVTSFNDNLYCPKPEVYFADTDISAASFTYISTSADTNILSYIADEIDADYRNALIVVKNDTEGNRIKITDENIRIMPVIIGRISASIKDIVI